MGAIELKTEIICYDVEGNPKYTNAMREIYDEEVKNALEKQQYITIDELKEKFPKWLNNYRDIKNVVDTARAEGKIEGKSEGKSEIAFQMKKDNEPIDKIQRYTGLSKEDIEQL